MNATTLTDAKANLERLMDACVDDHVPVIITRDGRPPVVLVSLADWNSEEETRFLLRSASNRASLELARQQLEAGDVVEMTMEELEAMTDAPQNAAVAAK